MRAGRQRFDNNAGGSDLYGGGVITGALEIVGALDLDGALNVAGDVTVEGTASLFLTPFGGGNAASVISYAGDPNGNVTAVKGSLAMDITNGGVWVNTTGLQVWVALAAGSGAASPLFDKVYGTLALVNGGVEADVNFGSALGQVSFCPFSSTVNEHITGVSNNGVAMGAGDDGKVICLFNAGANTCFVDSQGASSAASNRIVTAGGGTLGMLIGVGYWYRYDGAGLRFRQITYGT